MSVRDGRPPEIASSMMHNDQEYDDEYEEKDQGEDTLSLSSRFMSRLPCAWKLREKSGPWLRMSVDEINKSEKFQSIGDSRCRWLVDSGATSHIISERWQSNCKIVRLVPRYPLKKPPSRAWRVWGARGAEGTKVWRLKGTSAFRRLEGSFKEAWRRLQGGLKRASPWKGL